MTNTVMMSMLERTHEIGTLRALGWRQRSVLAIVLKESLAISLMGAAVGVVIALALNLLMRQIPMFGSLLVIVFSPGLLIRTLVVALCLGTVGGWYPA